MPDLIDQLTGSHIEAEPRVNEESVEALSAKLASDDQAGQQTPTRAPTDGAGTKTVPAPAPAAPAKAAVFDPRIHKTDESGKPVRRKDGKYAKKPGPKPPIGKLPDDDAPAAPAEISAPPAARVADYAKLGRFFSGMLFGTAENLLGPAWAPNTDERIQIEEAARDYAADKGISDIPPGIALLIAVGVYAVPRLNDDETKRRARAFGESLGILRPRPAAPAPASSSAPAAPAPVAPPAPPPNPFGGGIPAATAQLPRL